MIRQTDQGFEVTVPGWLWWLLGGLSALAVAAVAWISLPRRRRELEATIGPTRNLQAELSRQEVERVQDIDEELVRTDAALVEALDQEDPDQATTDLARLIDDWRPAAMLLLVGLLLPGCAGRHRPALFPVDPPAMAAPELPELPAAPADDCPSVAPLLPGQAAPFQVDGSATCRGVVLPQDRAAELTRQASLAPYWLGRAEEERRGRLQDRAWCEGAVDLVEQQAQDDRRVARAAPWITGGTGAAMLLLGVLVGSAL